MRLRALPAGVGVGEPVVRLDERVRDEIVPHLADQELRHNDDAFRLPGLGRVEYVFAVQTYVSLGDGYAVALEVEVLGHERKRLSAADTHPVQQLEQQERGVLVHDLAGERLVLVLGGLLSSTAYITKT